MADAYATLASGGIHHDPTAISRVEFPDGKVDEADDQVRRPGADRGPGLRSDENPRGRDHPGHRRRLHLHGLHGEAGKTGTSEGLSDAWFVGYTPLYSTAVWVGHPQSREETGFGGPTAGPIWRSFMESAAGGNCPEFEEPCSLPELEGLTANTPAPPRNPLPRPNRAKNRKKANEQEGRRQGKGSRRRRRQRTGAGSRARRRPRRPRPTPSPNPGTERRRKASAAASPRRPA